MYRNLQNRPYRERRMLFLLTSVSLALVLSLPVTQSVDLYCEEPPDIPLASIETVSDEEYPVGTTVTYTCQFGYTARGTSRTIRCEEFATEDEAEWTSPRFSCIPKSCGDPGYINNGRRIGSLFTFPSSVKYECDQGYKIRGLSTRYCQTSGRWSGRLPTCEKVICEPPEDPDNGHVIYSSLEYGSEISYKCNKGFHVSTDETIFCTSDGSWSNTDVQCIESACGTPLEPEYGSVQLSGSEGKPLAGSIAIFSCDGDRIPDGPTTSKCLETGEWTFPAPKCLEPCSVPYVTEGAIGRIQTYRRKTNFNPISVGTRIDDDMTLYVLCSDGYEVSNSENQLEKISCSHGKWSRELRCNPASCRTEPPSVENGQAVAMNPEHGKSVLYLCDEDFKKTKNETVICDFGKWKGEPPVCKITRCLVSDLSFRGLVKGRKSVYRDGEVFKIECESRYQVAKVKLAELRCEEGSWKGPLPPCVGARCTKPPPQIDHGRPEDISSLHGSIVKYVCEEPFILVGNSHVQCSFGEWEGQPPKCEDSRCFLKNLQKSERIDTAVTPSATQSGYRLDVICEDGYSPRSTRPLCLNGKWTQNSESPCKQKDCTIPYLPYGEIKEEKLGDYYWNWRRFRYDRDVIYEKIPIGRIINFGTSLLLFCNSGYSFHGKREGRKGVTCSKGRWEPDPVCLPVGTPYVPPTTSAPKSPIAPTKFIVPQRTKASSTSTTAITTTTNTEPPFAEDIDEESPVDEEIVDLETVFPQTECYCEYIIDDKNLVAHADGKRLQSHDKVKDGSVVVFRCEHVGFHKLAGPLEVVCEDCRNWHSSEFPTCIEPKSGSAVILFDNTLNVSIEGDLEAKKGQNIKLMCAAMESRTYPHWSSPAGTGVTITQERKVRESYGDVLYISHLEIQNADVENEGPYGCAVGNNSMNFVNLIIDDPDRRCPEFLDENGIQITYDNGRRVNSQVSFSCTKRDQQLIGKAVLTCLKSGDWSGLPPECADKKCRELKQNDLLMIQYSNDRKIGSRATFHCFSPGKRSGASYATCLENETWSEPTPSCKTPPCSLEKLFSELPKNTALDDDAVNTTFPYNTTMKLTCEEGMITDGNPAAICGMKGEWEFQNVQCLSGCPKIVKSEDSVLIIKPEKDIYKLGAMVTFSCPPGMRLDKQPEVIMCLKYGWSDTILPECK